MNMSKLAIGLALGTTVSLLTQLNLPVAADTIQHGPIPTNRCYGNNSNIIYIARVVSSLDQPAINRVVENTPNQCVSELSGTTTHWILPSDTSQHLLLGWKNISSGNYGWVLVVNTPSTWLFKTNSNSSLRPIGENGESTTQRWTGNGVSIWLHNPVNENGWTPDHIQYRFQHSR
jgi:hypothetical protein